MELKPCPFCGGKAKIYATTTGTYPNHAKHYCYCEKCLATSQSFSDFENDGSSVFKAIEAWNKRATMDEYIGRETAYAPSKRICDAIRNREYHPATFGQFILDWIDDLPSADVQPVRHGRWIFKADSSWRGGGKYECSACKYGYAIGAYHEPDEFTYCPHCGAYMKDGWKE